MIVLSGKMMKIKRREGVSNIDINVVNNQQCTFLIFGLKGKYPFNIFSLTHFILILSRTPVCTTLIKVTIKVDITQPGNKKNKVTFCLHISNIFLLIHN